MAHKSLESWLSYIESQHPSEIELGLDRGKTVLDRLQLSRPKNKVITVAGTNGKGSTCAMLTQYLCSQKCSVGTYTSPHFLLFNERIALNNQSCDDEILCRAFDVIEAARGDIPLTYFEFSTLAALWVFDQSELDYWVLEVGLGGRLDSVNMIDTDLAVITSISLDHVDWLGDNLDVIAREKAGIARRGKPLISGVVNPPASISDVSQEVGADLQQKGRDFTFLAENTMDSNAAVWSWTGYGKTFSDLPLPSLPLQNAATVIAVLLSMGFDPHYEDLASLFSTAKLTGRFQQVSFSPDVFIDVAHNPEAAIELAHRIESFSRPPLAVCGMLKDKDIGGVIRPLVDQFSDWYCCDLVGPRGAKSEDIIDNVIHYAPNLSDHVYAFESLQKAFITAFVKAKEEQRSIIVFGSFITVSDYLAFSQ